MLRLYTVYIHLPCYVERGEIECVFLYIERKNHPESENENYDNNDMSNIIKNILIKSPYHLYPKIVCLTARNNNNNNNKNNYKNNNVCIMGMIM